MDIPLSALNYAVIVERIFSASTLEDAIAWREAMLARLKLVTSTQILSAPELRLHRDAQILLENSLSHLRVSLLNEARVNWDHSKKAFIASNVWSKQP